MMIPVYSATRYHNLDCFLVNVLLSFAFILPFHIYTDKVMAPKVYQTDNSLLFLAFSSILNYLFFPVSVGK